MLCHRPFSVAVQPSVARWVTVLAFVLLGFSNVTAAEILGKNGVAATGHPLATDAAVAAFKAGGNAVDAAVAAALTLGVVDGFNSGIGGGCFFLVRTERGSVVAIDGRETAPAAAKRDMFVRDGKAVPELSQTGALAIGVPGSLAAYDYAVRHFGKLQFSDLLRRAAAVAEDGFELDEGYAGRLHGAAEALNRFEASRAAFLKSDGEPYRAGEILKQPDLARTYRAIADEGIGWFYETEFSRQVEAYGSAGGVLWGISTSGNSGNVVEAFKVAKQMGMTTIGMTGEGGGRMAEFTDVLIDVPSRSTPMIQQIHICLYHYICEQVEARLDI